MKIKFNSNGDIPLNKVLYIPNAIVVIRNTFEKDGEYYPQIFLHDCLYEIYSMKELILVKKLILIKQINQ